MEVNFRYRVTKDLLLYHGAFSLIRQDVQKFQLKNVTINTQMLWLLLQFCTLLFVRADFQQTLNHFHFKLYQETKVDIFRNIRKLSGRLIELYKSSRLRIPIYYGTTI